MKVIIAEKPSVARQIASIVGATIRKEGYLEGNGYTVTWAFGHLVGLAMPESYGFKGFRKENLPILPEVFRLEPRTTKSGKEYKPDPKVMKQLKIIKELFEQAERIIVATDAGREGELIFRYIYQYLDCNKPFDRLWINSLTDQAIREGLRNIRPGKEYDNLYLSARARSEADWIVGINASQALAIAAGRGVWSLGRVQTPTLALVCQRYLENRDFTAQTFYRLKLHTAKDAAAFSALSIDKYASQDEATKHRQAVLESTEVRVIKVESRETMENVPLLYDLTSLQRDANRRHGFPAEKTLNIAQDLYEAKLITYPRTGSRYIPEDLFAQVPALLNSLQLHPEFGRYALELAENPLNRHSVNNAKVTDHHALLITGNVPSKLSAEQSKIYDMIAGRMLEAFSEVCVKGLTTVRIECAGHLFEVRATTILQAGWRRICHEKEETSDEEAAALPTLHENDVLLMWGCDLLEKETRPRPLHTESSLLAAMETAGKELDNEAEREAMKDSGLGTPATRAHPPGETIADTHRERTLRVQHRRRQTHCRRSPHRRLGTRPGKDRYRRDECLHIQTWNRGLRDTDHQRTAQSTDPGIGTGFVPEMRSSDGILPEDCQVSQLRMSIGDFPNDGREGTFGRATQDVDRERPYRCHQGFQ